MEVSRINFRKTIYVLVGLVLTLAALNFISHKSACKISGSKDRLKVGEIASDFTLKDINNVDVNLKKELQKGSVVLSFYRGGWCPICNNQLKEFQSRLSEIHSMNAQLIAVSPETPDNAQLTMVKNKLNFTVLHDKNNDLARKYGITWEVPDNAKKGFSDWLKSETGKTLEDYNNKAGYELPIPATFVIRPDGKVTYAFVDHNYRVRADIDDVLRALR